MPSTDDQMCVLARDGRPVAGADSHGTWLHWLRGPAAGSAGRPPDRRVLT